MLHCLSELYVHTMYMFVNIHHVKFSLIRIEARRGEEKGCSFYCVRMHVIIFGYSKGHVLIMGTCMYVHCTWFIL